MVGPQRNENVPDARGSELDTALRGSLPCINCGYELQGLSIRGNCPECGLAIRASILYRVDPHADAFKPMPNPRLTALAVALWTGAGVVAVLAAWLPRLADAMADWTGGRIESDARWAPLVVVVALSLSALGAIGLIRPIREASRVSMAAACAGVLAYAPLIWSVAQIHWRVDAVSLSPYFRAPADAHRIALRLMMGVSALVILLCLRPNARQLVARSLVLRTGRVDRQTIYATAAAVVAAMVGDLVRLISTTMAPGDRAMVAGVGTIIVLVGSMFLTLAVVGAAVDGWRIRRAILTPSPSLRELLEDRAGEGE